MTTAERHQDERHQDETREQVRKHYAAAARAVVRRAAMVVDVDLRQVSVPGSMPRMTAMNFRRTPSPPVSVAEIR